MRLLLDTHALIYLLGPATAMRTEALDAVRNPDNVVFFSAANVWEIEIKVKLRKLTAPTSDVITMARRQGYADLAMEATHARDVGRLPLHHHDPFDRMLVAQAMAEGLTVVTRDRIFANYDVPVLPC